MQVFWFTLPHEHLLFNESNWMGEGDEEEKLARAPLQVNLSTLGELQRNRNASLVNLQSNEEIATEELGLFRDAGESTVVDVSPPDLNRNVKGLKRLSEASGVNIIAATGHYCAFVHPREVAGQSVDELARWMVKEITEGIDEPPAQVQDSVALQVPRKSCSCGLGATATCRRFVTEGGAR
jgi:phosphotriesterase-related protein